MSTNQPTLFDDLPTPIRDPRRYSFTKFQTRDEAIRTLSSMRADLLRKARAVAEELGRRPSGVTSQEILSEMDRRGMIDERERELDQRWIGALWSPREFRDRFVVVSLRIQRNKDRNTHGAARRAWKLREGGDDE